MVGSADSSTAASKLEASVVAAVEKVDEIEEKRDKATDPLNTYLQVPACLEDIHNGGF